MIDKTFTPGSRESSIYRREMAQTEHRPSRPRPVSEQLVGEWR